MALAAAREEPQRKEPADGQPEEEERRSRTRDVPPASESQKRRTLSPAMPRSGPHALHRTADRHCLGSTAFEATCVHKMSKRSVQISYVHIKLCWKQTAWKGLRTSSVCFGWAFNQLASCQAQSPSTSLHVPMRKEILFVAILYMWRLQYYCHNSHTIIIIFIKDYGKNINCTGKH